MIVVKIISRVMDNTEWWIVRRKQEKSWEDVVFQRYHPRELCSEDIAFISESAPSVYCNDLTGKEWCFDQKLPSGIWLENILVGWQDGKRVCHATVFI